MFPPAGFNMTISPTQWLAIAAAAAVAAVAVRWAFGRSAGRSGSNDHGALHRELRTELASLRHTLEGLAADLQRFERSPVALANPERLADVERDLQEVRRWRSALPPNDDCFAKLSAVDVDIELIEMVATHVRAAGLRLDYEADLAVIGDREVHGDLPFLPLPLAARKIA